MSYMSMTIYNLYSFLFIIVFIVCIIIYLLILYVGICWSKGNNAKKDGVINPQNYNFNQF